MRIQWLLKDLRHSVPDVLHLVSGTIHDCFTDTLLEMKRNLGINLPVISKLLPGNLPRAIPKNIEKKSASLQKRYNKSGDEKNAAQ